MDAIGLFHTEMNVSSAIYVNFRPCLNDLYGDYNSHSRHSEFLARLPRS